MLLKVQNTSEPLKGGDTQRMLRLGVAAVALEVAAIRLRCNGYGEVAAAAVLVAAVMDRWQPLSLHAPIRDPPVAKLAYRVRVAEDEGIILFYFVLTLFLKQKQPCDTWYPRRAEARTRRNECRPGPHHTLHAHLTPPP
tara:strand:- start:529 stop:945 length:417 start_codon:yes stop_codon:yes gene_type:complete